MIKEKSRTTVFMVFNSYPDVPDIIHILDGEVWKSTFDEYFSAGELTEPENTIFKAVNSSMVEHNAAAKKAFLHMGEAEYGEPANGLTAEQRRADYAILHEFITGSPFIFR